MQTEDVTEGRSRRMMSLTMVGRMVGKVVRPSIAKEIADFDEKGMQIVLLTLVLNDI